MTHAQTLSAPTMTPNRAPQLRWWRPVVGALIGLFTLPMIAPWWLAVGVAISGVLAVRWPGLLRRRKTLLGPILVAAMILGYPEHWQAGPLGALIYLVAWWWWLAPSWLRTRPRGGLPAPDVVDGNLLIYGTPGAGLQDAGRFGVEAVRLGVEGECRTVAHLRKALAGSPVPVVLVNALRFPGSKRADVDHVLIVGNTAWVIDSKLWASGTWQALDARRLELRRPDGTKEIRETHMLDALHGFRAKIPDLVWRQALIAIHPKHPSARDFQVRPSSLLEVRPVSIADLVMVVQAQLPLAARVPLDPAVVQRVLACRQ